MRRAWTVAGALVVAGLLGSGGGQSPQSAIPDDLLVIAAACRENSARIGSLQLSGTLFATGGHYEGQWDPITGEMYNSQTQEFSLWKDALNFRFDITADREVGPENEVNYHIPYGEHITSYAKLEREGGVDALKREHGTPQRTRRVIVTPETVYRYEPELNILEMNIDAAFNLAALHEQGGVQLALNKTLNGSTVAEFLDRWTELAQRGDRSMELTPLGAGQYRIRAVVTSQRDSHPAHTHVLDVVADVDQGGNVLSYVRQTDGQIVESARFEYMNAGGAWVVAHAEISGQVAPGLPPVCGVYDVHPESVRVNEPIDPQVFTFEGLAVRRGALVFDAETREEYLYDDVPLHLKVALAMEREREEELAEAAAQAAATPLPAPAPELGEEVQRDEPSEAPVPPRVNDPVRRSQQSERSSRPVSPRIEPAARATDRTAETVVVTPASQAAPQSGATPDRTPVNTRVLTTRAAYPAPSAQLREPTAEPVGVTGRWAPRGTVTAAAVSAGAAAAIGIGIWRLARRGTPRVGS